MSEWTKHDKGKPMLSLLPANALAEVARVMEHGAEKYGADNWKRAPSPVPYVDAALRHLFHQGRAPFSLKDPDSSLPALAHAAASCLIALELALREGKVPSSDRPPVMDPVRRGPIVGPGDERG